MSAPFYNAWFAQGLPRGEAVSFIFGYLARKREYALIAAASLAAALCAVGVQITMKLLVDGMNQHGRSSAVYLALGLFFTLLAVESVLWRTSGVLVCRATTATGVDIRLDLFDR